MSVLKGRPEPVANDSEAHTGPGTRPGRRRARLADRDVVKITTRLTHGLARDMRIKAQQQGITIEEAFTDAVMAYLRNG